MAQLGCESPCQPPAGRSRGFPYIHPQLSWLRNAIFKILRLISFFSKKYFYLHKTIKSEQLFPEKLWPSGAAAGHMRRSLFTSNSFTWQCSAGTCSFFWCKDYFSVPLVLPLLALRTDRSVFTSATWIRQVPLYTAQLESVERSLGWWIKHTQPSFKCYQVAKSTFGAGETIISYYKRQFSPFLLIFKKETSDQTARVLPGVLPCTGQRESQPGCSLPGDARVCWGFGRGQLLRPLLLCDPKWGTGELRHRGAEVVHWHGQAGAGSWGPPGARWHCPPWWLAWRPAPAWASFHLLWKTRGEQVNPWSRTLQPPPAIFKTISIPNKARDAWTCLEKEGLLREGECIYGWASHWESRPTFFAEFGATVLPGFGSIRASSLLATAAHCSAEEEWHCLFAPLCLAQHWAAATSMYQHNRAWANCASCCVPPAA